MIKKAKRDKVHAQPNPHWWPLHKFTWAYIWHFPLSIFFSCFHLVVHSFWFSFPTLSLLVSLSFSSFFVYGSRYEIGYKHRTHLIEYATQKCTQQDFVMALKRQQLHFWQDTCYCCWCYLTTTGRAYHPQHPLYTFTTLMKISLPIIYQE